MISHASDNLNEKLIDAACTFADVVDVTVYLADAVIALLDTISIPSDINHSLVMIIL